MSALDADTIRRRFLVLRALRWLPTGLIVPVFILILLDRGLSLGQIGLVTAAQGAVIFFLELPTGGLADTLGRRQVLILADLFDLASVGLLLFADTIPLLVCVLALQGVYRALESGPLDAWYVDAAQAADPDADIEGGLSAAGVVLGLSLATGTLAGGGLVAWAPFASLAPLLTPLVFVLLLRLVDLGAIATLMTTPSTTGPRPTYRQTMIKVPTVVSDALRLVRASHALLALLGVELLWGFGMVGFETYTPVKLSVVLGTTERAAAVLGPTNALAWGAAAAGAAAVPWLSRRIGTWGSGTALLAGQAAFMVVLAIAGGPVAVVIAYVLTMTVHGAANPVHQGLLHRAVEGSRTRATVLSANSLAGHAGGALGGITLGVVADATSLTTAILVGAGSILVAGLLYQAARRASDRAGGIPLGPVVDRTQAQ